MTLGEWLGGRAGYGAWPFPRHRVRLAWLVALVGVTTILIYVPLETMTRILILVPLLGAVTGITVMAVLDWSCGLPLGQRRIVRITQAAVRVSIASLGGIGVVTGVWMLSRVLISLRWRGELVALQALLLAGLAISVCVMGAALTILPYARLRISMEQHGGDGA